MRLGAGKIEGILLDADYKDTENASVIRLFLRTESGIKHFEFPSFKPYFYILTDGSLTEKKLLEIEFGEKAAKILAAERMEFENAENAFKIYFSKVSDLMACREEIKHVKGVLEKREYDIPFSKRFLINNALQPMNMIEIELDKEGNATSAKAKELQKSKFKIYSIDIETYSPGKFSSAKKDPIMMISVAGKDYSKVFSYKKKLAKLEFCKIMQNEKAMLEAFVQELKLLEPDIIVTYNGDQFDFPYIKERCKINGVDFKINSDKTEPSASRKGMDTAFRLKGVQHLDAYQMVAFLTRFQVINLIKYDLESVSAALLGKPKDKFDFKNIQEVWEGEKGIEALAKYNLEDSQAAFEIVQKYLPLSIEVCRLGRLTLYDASRITGGMLVEQLLIIKSFEQNLIVPSKPHESTVTERMSQEVEGAFVREPTHGLHENIAVIDFRSFHPTIIITHNVSPETIDCEHKECASGKNVSPTGHYFCEKNQGFIPRNLAEVLKQRFAFKNEFKKAKKSDENYDLLFAKQWAFKIVLNSFFGYLGYPRSRWYCRECGNSILAWTRHYIKQTMHRAEQDGFEVIYGDTDSAMLKLGKKTREDLEKFVEKVNKEVPKPMELELENFYKRGIFVMQKSGNKAAKKRYALIDYKDNLKIVGFEYVRRDWSNIAKQTQKEVIEAVLKEGNPEKAAQIVKKRITDLKEGKVPKKELVVFSEIQKPLEKYDIINPQVSAALKARKKGVKIEVGTIVGYIITRSGKSISEKAELEEFVQEGNYDADYYIMNQVLPAVERIMQELGYTVEDLKHGGKQTKLF
ncbi:MAG: DNA-directed DNA polymerase [Candidatus Diapherotrites archaeon]|nr:DNA-directed DNA polymerase [Candidatus Diapherotrites archaeon]